MSDYQILTKTAWSIQKTIQNPIKAAKKNLLKRYYYCRFNTRETKLSETNRKKGHASRNINCPAKIIVSVNRVPPQYSRASQPNIIAENWPCLILFTNDHHHTILLIVRLLYQRDLLQTKQFKKFSSILTKATQCRRHTIVSVSQKWKHLAMIMMK